MEGKEKSRWTRGLQLNLRPVSMPAPYDVDDDEDEMALKLDRPRVFARTRSGTASTSSKPIPIPCNPNVIPGNNLPSAPASPPTPAASPSPRPRGPDWRTAATYEDMGLSEDDLANESEDSRGESSIRGRSKAPQGLGYRHIRSRFAEMGDEERKRLLCEMLNMCNGRLLGFVASFVGPRLKRDPFGVLPNELCFRV